MRKEFYKHLTELIERGEQTIGIFDSVNEANDWDESDNQKSTKVVHEKLLTLKRDYDTLTDQEIQQRFQTIIRENPPTKPKAHRESIYAKWAKILRRSSGFGRTRKGGKDQKHD